ncbi:hypothetical protein PG985_011618 [Apiospora marii]|uniref:uncharacterized protein n=1 Tax=Apiospora marii TaxID=335849 RepID=UPI00312F2699
MVPKPSTDEHRSLEDHARIKTSDEASGAESASEQRRILPHDTSVTCRSWTQNDEGRSQHLAEGGELPARLDEANAAVAPTEISEATSEYYSQSSATSTITTMTTEDYATCLERGALQAATLYDGRLGHREHTQGQPRSTFKDESGLRGTNQVNNISEENRLLVGGAAAENSRLRDNYNDGSGDLSYLDDDGYSPLPFPDDYWSYDEVVRNYYHINKENGGQKPRTWYPPEFLKAHGKARGVFQNETYKNEYWTFDEEEENYYHLDRENGHEIKVWYP